MESVNRSSVMATFFTLLGERVKLSSALRLVVGGSEGLRVAADRLQAAGDIESAQEMRDLAECIEESVVALGLRLSDDAAELAAERECLATWHLIAHDDEPLPDTLGRLMALAAGDLETARRPVNPRARLRAVR